MDSFTFLFLGSFLVGVAAALLGKVKDHHSLHGAISMFMIAGIVYYAVAPVLIIPIPLPLPLFARCLGYVFLMVSMKGIVCSLLEPEKV